jgi:hypothetical protein
MIQEQILAVSSSDVDYAVIANTCHAYNIASELIGI